MQAKVHTGVNAFIAALDTAALQRLMALGTTAVQTPPATFQRWWCGSALMGLLPPDRLQWLEEHLPQSQLAPHGLVWNAPWWSRSARSDALQAVLEMARAQGMLTGWRNERFSYWHSACSNPDPLQMALLDVERSGFRFLGMLSQAVHVNGFLPDGRLWIARRAMNKATDPGMLDNVTAGGLPSGETVLQCLLRELNEEAGITSIDGLEVTAVVSVRTSRVEPQGWHDEVLHVFNITLPFGFKPQNRDGEVAEFICMSPVEVLQSIESGEMTQDANQSLRQGLLLQYETMQKTAERKEV